MVTPGRGCWAILGSIRGKRIRRFAIMARHGFDMLPPGSKTKAHKQLLPDRANWWCYLLISLWDFCRKPKTHLRTTLAAMTSTLMQHAPEGYDTDDEDDEDELHRRHLHSIGMNVRRMGGVEVGTIDFVKMMQKADDDMKMEETDKIRTELNQATEKEELARQVYEKAIIKEHDAAQQVIERAAETEKRMRKYNHLTLVRMQKEQRTELALIKIMLPCVNQKFKSIFHNFVWPDQRGEFMPCGDGDCGHLMLSHVANHLSHDAITQVVIYLSH